MLLILTKEATDLVKAIIKRRGGNSHRRRPLACTDYQTALWAIAVRGKTKRIHVDAHQGPSFGLPIPLAGGEAGGHSRDFTICIFISLALVASPQFHAPRSNEHSLVLVLGGRQTISILRA
jgi:hypothetical protein